jgi:hypothetical protein
MTDKLDGLLGDKDRRRFFRHACTASLEGVFEYDRTDKWSGRVRRGYLKTDALAQRHLRVFNISEGGAAVVSEYPVSKGATISLKISTAFDTSFQARARVAWTKRLKHSADAYAVGLEFVEMSRADTRKLKELLDIFDQTSTSRQAGPE